MTFLLLHNCWEKNSSKFTTQIFLQQFLKFFWQVGHLRFTFNSNINLFSIHRFGKISRGASSRIGSASGWAPRTWIPRRRSLSIISSLRLSRSSFRSSISAFLAAKNLRCIRARISAWRPARSFAGALTGFFHDFKKMSAFFAYNGWAKRS